MNHDLVCYCFHHTLDDIVRDAMANGRSTLAEAILQAKQQGACRCASTNPTGR